MSKALKLYIKAASFGLAILAAIVCGVFGVIAFVAGDAVLGVALFVVLVLALAGLFTALELMGD